MHRWLRWEDSERRSINSRFFKRRIENINNEHPPLSGRAKKGGSCREVAMITVRSIPFDVGSM
jgi:hypothetical protein